MASTPRKKKERHLPYRQLVVLGIARFAEPVALTSVFPYLPEMIESLDIPADEVAKWAGIATAVFSLAQAIFGVPWGRASDRYGRKTIILIGLTSTMLTSIMWGFSKSIWVAVLSRGLQGAGNGNVGIIRTTVAEMVPYKELQPRAFSIMPLIWNIGSIFGPAFGGALANPNRIKPGQPMPENATFLDRFPYALPNMVAAVLFLLGIAAGYLFLDETLDSKKNEYDRGRALGKGITHVFMSGLHKLETLIRGKQGPEHERLLKAPTRSGTLSDEETALQERKTDSAPAPTFREVLTPQSTLNLVCYTLLALHNISFDQLIPIFMHYPVKDHSANNPDFKPPFKFSGGYGLNNADIGVLFTLYGVSGMIVQFLVFPPVARKFGVVNCLRAVSILTPFVYLVVPFTTLLPTQRAQTIAGFACMVAKGFCSTFGFPCSTILLTNSASSLRSLATLNGLATSVGAIGRGIGPALCGTIFTIGVERGYIIAAWWVMSGLAVLAAIPVFWIVEGEGFGGEEDDHVEDSDDEGDDDKDEAEDEGAVMGGGLAPKRQGMLKPPSTTGASVEGVEEEEAEAADSIGPLLSETTTNSTYQSILGDDGEELDPDDPELYRRNAERRSSSGSGGKRLKRKVTLPLNIHNKGISKRYSSNLGHSLGSAGCHNE